jgi:hypothetical protein
LVIEEQHPQQLGQGLRNGFACLALGQQRHARVALLMEWQQGLNRLLSWWPWGHRRQPRGQSQELASYVEQLSRGEGGR